MLPGNNVLNLYLIFPKTVDYQGWRIELYIKGVDEMYGYHLDDL